MPSLSVGYGYERRKRAGNTGPDTGAANMTMPTGTEVRPFSLVGISGMKSGKI